MPDVATFLNERSEAAASAATKAKSPASEEFQDLWRSISDLYAKRLWHQMTVKLLVLVDRKEMSGADLKALYDNAICDFESK